MTPLAYTVAIPTMDRPAELLRAIAHARRLEPPPARFLVVDDGTADIDALRDACGPVPLDYHRKAAPGLLASLNCIADLAQTPWTLIIDDDIELDPGFAAAMQQAAAQHPDAAGFAGYPVQPGFADRRGRQSLRRALERLFLLGGGTEGRFLSSGYCTDYECGRRPGAPWRVEHVPGGLGLWRTEVLRAFRFDPWYEGYAYGNDKEFAFRVSRRHALFAVPAARAIHAKSPRARIPSARLGAMKIRNQARFFRLHRRAGRFSAFAFAWATAGLLLISALGCIGGANVGARLAELRGMLRMAARVLLGRGLLA